jgi:glucan endo-1,3-alpha-glucosidase
MTTDRDLMYMGFTEATNKEYMAPVSPWCESGLQPADLGLTFPTSIPDQKLMAVFTHFGQEVPYAKNWLFYSETLWYDRWEQILKLGDRLNFLESKHLVPASHSIGKTDESSRHLE